MATTNEKRKRPDTSPEWWIDTSSWVRDNGGQVHSGISIGDNDRQLVLTEPIEKGATLFEIPQPCLVSCESIQNTAIGKELAKAIEPLDLYSNHQDVLVALALAHQLDHGDGEGKYCCGKTYLKTLPSKESFDSLPRRWSSDEAQDLLQGSTFLSRIQEATKGVVSDCVKIQEALGRDYPSFDTMLAAVTSRAFAGMGASASDEDIAMVCLLDLCNHTRGKTKTVSFERQQGSGAVVASAHHKLEAGDVLCITYGAKGNHQLLYNYGFCIENNLEPDGSSNDICEVILNNTTVSLRTGPKSYTFGCLARAVELFYSQDEGAAIAADGPDDLESFLNDCEEEEDDEVGDFIMEEQADDEEEDDNVNMEGLRDALLLVKAGYSLQGDKQRQALESTVESHRNAAILIRSELRTLMFYELACQRVVERLSKCGKPETFSWLAGRIDADDVLRLEAQAIELAEVFVQIRYPHFVSS